ncbi:hypothetical protein SADUNF_Sadunf16G0082900 [Salix dunnii]|uniref:Uncharacterized protein n=1 Tax=Salix dunnii TaxID=1413687 RepID=A0A835ML80_9ROSI|nr:hypothetical protein SADUNF_Sadunf16G0082900 [Salix dunnii]
MQSAWNSKDYYNPISRLTLRVLKGVLTLALNTDNLYTRAITREQGDAMTTLVTRDEIKEALFSIPDTISMQIMKEALDKFIILFGLSINHRKNIVFVTGLEEAAQDQLLDLPGIPKSTTAPTYLRVPLITMKLTNECNNRAFHNHAKSMQTLSKEVYQQMRDLLANTDNSHGVMEAINNIWNLSTTATGRRT